MGVGGGGGGRKEGGGGGGRGGGGRGFLGGNWVLLCYSREGSFPTTRSTTTAVFQSHFEGFEMTTDNIKGGKCDVSVMS